MDVYDAIVRKRDTRRFSEEPVPDGGLRRVLQAGRMAGSAKNQQLNRIVLVTDAGDRGVLSGCGKFADWLAGCPVILVLAVPKEGGNDFDMGRMAQNIMVAAHGLGLASCPVTLQDEDTVADLLAIPGDYRAPMGVGIGHPAPAVEEKRSSPRIPLDELVNWGRWAS